MSKTCPPCHHNCSQGRFCPARNQRHGEHMKFISLIGLLALTACGTYAVRVFDYGHAERGEAPAEAPAESDKGDKGDDNGQDAGAEAGEKGSGKGGSGKDKGDDD